MKNKIILLSCFSLSTAYAAIPPEKLLQKDCTQCHGNWMYEREDKKTKDFKALKRRVNFCKNPANATWFDDETEAVIHYLNDHYYHFDTK